MISANIRSRNGDKLGKVAHLLKVAYIIGTYPLLTTTFIDREIMLLQQHGVTVDVLSIRRSSRKLSPEQRALQEDVTYLLPVSPPLLLIAHLYFVVRRPLNYLGIFFFLLTRSHPTPKSRLKTVLHFGEGVYAAYLLREKAYDQLHAHFVDRATTVALIASRLLDIPYSATAHANDIYVEPVLLPEKVAEAKFVATCTNYNKVYLERILSDEESAKVRCIYHGLDLSDYQPPERTVPLKPLLLSVGQLKEKKGFAYLLEACRFLRDWDYDFHCMIVGEGPLRGQLETQICHLGLEDTVSLCGALAHEEVIEKYREATIFVLPCILSADGDRDGIPNVILEAMAMELPVVSTRHSGIPEVVQDNLNGLLVPPAEAEPLAKALARLLDDPEKRLKYGMKGRETIIEAFAVESNVNKLLREFLV
jgi:glycosyltransferase involved in cell wall biosynthesis